MASKCGAIFLARAIAQDLQRLALLDVACRWPRPGGGKAHGWTAFRRSTGKRRASDVRTGLGTAWPVSGSTTSEGRSAGAAAAISEIAFVGVNRAGKSCDVRAIDESSSARGRLAAVALVVEVHRGDQFELARRCGVVARGLAQQAQSLAPSRPAPRPIGDEGTIDQPRRTRRPARPRARRSRDSAQVAVHELAGRNHAASIIQRAGIAALRRLAQQVHALPRLP